MATQWIELGAGAYALLGGSNIGALICAGRAVMVDTGLDRDAAKKAWRAIEAAGGRLEAIVLTHGHTDHCGGAGWLAAQTGAAVYAAPLEGAFAAQPLLEPLFLYGGAAPIAELRGKFTLAAQGVAEVRPLYSGAQEIAGAPLTVIPLPGHAPEQVGIACGDVLFCGDVVFPPETLERHPILFCADMDAWLTTLDGLPEYAHIVPGHGAVCADLHTAAALTAARLRDIRGRVWEALATPAESAELLRAVAATFGVTFAAPQFFLLALTTIHAALTSLQRAGEAEVVMMDNRMVWRRRS